MTQLVQTAELRAGDIVDVLPGANIFRTVDTVAHSGYENRAGRDILTIRYVEGKTAEWSEGNSTTDIALWSVIGRGWIVSGTAGELLSRRLSTGQLAAIWRYQDADGTEAFKLFTDRDNGDYVALDFAVAAAVVVESLGAVTVAL